MASVTTTDEAVGALRAALAKWRSEARGVISQASAAATGFHSEATREVRQRRTRLAALQRALGALRPEVDPTPLRRQIAAAEAALVRATRATAVAEGVEREARALDRRTAQATEGYAAAAELDLGRRLESLSGYRVGSTGATTSIGSTASTVRSGADSTASPTDQALRKLGLVSVPLGTASHADNPVIDGYHKGGATRSDYRWAIETWETIVLPGLAAGANRDDFVRRDEARGAIGFRRTAGVYDMFLGDGRLVFSRRPDGSLDVTNGRHRIDIARGLGISHLPGEIR